jgi:cytoskeletal protein RodZ
MIGWKTKPEEAVEDSKPKGFDDYDIRLGDLMRGERATLGKSLLDVQRELRIKANYIAAIENCDPTAFDTPGFIAGYVRSYARYLGMDPDLAFSQFCAESGFSTAHGMSAAASAAKPAKQPQSALGTAGRDPFTAPATPFVPAGDALFSRIEPRAIGSSLVLLVLIGSLGFGAWSVLQEVQRVQFAPVENTPDVLAVLDPVQGAGQMLAEDVLPDARAMVQMAAPIGMADGLDRPFRPQPLDVPVMVSRDAPISTLDPADVGVFAQSAPQMPQVDRETFPRLALAVETQTGTVAMAAASSPTLPKVSQDQGAGVTVVAARPSWVRVRAADGTVVFEGIMGAGETYEVAHTEVPHTIRVGESGAIYFNVGGQTYGPAGERGAVTSNLALDAGQLAQNYALADLAQDGDLARVVAELTPGN